MKRHDLFNKNITRELLYKYGCALNMQKISDAGNCIKEIMRPQKYKEMVENTKKLARPNASKDIVEFLIKQKKTLN